MRMLLTLFLCAHSAVALAQANVRDFGATGDGHTNDQPAIMAAINSLANKGGVVFFPAGEYAVAAEVGLRDVAGTTYAGITLQGVGAASHIKPLAYLNAATVIFKGVSNYSLTDIAVKYMHISGFDEVTSVNGPVIIFSNCDRALISESVIDTNAREGIYSDNPLKVRNFTVRGNYVTHVGGYNSVTNQPLSAYNLNADNISMTGNRAYQVGQAIEQTGSGGIVANNIFEYMATSGGSVYCTALNMNSTGAGRRMIVEGNIIRYASKGMVTANVIGEYVIANNLFENCDQGISLTNTSTPATVRGNYFYDTAGGTSNEAINHTSGSVAAVISGNTIVAGPTSKWSHAITINDPAAADVVSGNTVIGDAVTTDVFQVNSSNTFAQLIENTIVPGTMASSATRYKWRGVNFKKDTLSGIDSGTVFSTAQPSRVRGGGVPAVGTWSLGDVVVNASPVAGGTDRWVCTGAGTPGTWSAVGLSGGAFMRKRGR